MPSIPDFHKKVGKYYDTNILEYEKIRLDQDSPIEYAITLRSLSEYVPQGATIVDVGVGVGHYAEFLAKRDCKLHLVDIAQKFLDLTLDRLKKNNLRQSILSCNYGTATDLSFIKSSSADVVLMLGPLYHLCSESERYQAIAVSHRILKEGGLLIASAINRLAYFRDRFFSGTENFSLKDFMPKLYEYQETGNTDPETCPILGYAHLATMQEFIIQFKPFFETIHLAGLESFSSFQQEQFFKKQDSDKELWLDLIYKTGLTQDGMAMSEHFFFVGKKATEVWLNT